MGPEWLLPFLAGIVLTFALTVPGNILVKRREGLQGRTIDDVADFIFDPGEDKLLVSLDSTEDNLWRREGDRRVQRIRVERFHDCLVLMVSNVTVLYEVGKAERDNPRRYGFTYDADLSQRIQRLVDDALLFLRIAALVRRQIRFFRLTRFETVFWMPVPQLTKFKTISGVDLIEAYKAVATAAEALLLAHGEVEPIKERIRTCFWVG